MRQLIFITFILCSSIAYALAPPAEKARGLFVAFGVGPRLPVGTFANTSDLGYGFNLELDYTDNEYIPFFVFAKVGYEVYPGSQQFYQTTEYSNYSTNALPVNFGIRYYFPPLMENVVLFLPVLEASINYTYYEKLHQFKITSNKVNFKEDISKIGFSIGTGLSMFLMEIMASYNYFVTNQFLALDLKIRLPLYIIY